MRQIGILKLHDGVRRKGQPQKTKAVKLFYQPPVTGKWYPRQSDRECARRLKSSRRVSDAVLPMPATTLPDSLEIATTAKPVQTSGVIGA